jgi:hypothetical protein
MALLTTALVGALGGIALPQDPIPVRAALKPINPQDDPRPPTPTTPPKNPNDPRDPNCHICRLTGGAIVAVIVAAAFGARLPTGFFEQALIAFAAGAVGSTLIGSAWNAIRKK